MPTSWNRLPQVRHARLIDWRDRDAALPVSATPVLAWGNGRSRGDVCLNDGGTLLLTGGMDRLIAFDRVSGVLECETGLTLGDALRFCMPQGWMLPVVPGTQFVTVGGAIANDVHGRNHHHAGNFGRHVLSIELARSTGERVRVGPDREPELFAATVGGLGLTGLMTHVRLQLVPVSNAFLLTENVAFRHLDEFWELDARLGSHWPYTVARIDGLARGSRLGRGVFLAGRHAPPQPAGVRLPLWRDASRSVPLDLPSWMLNRYSVRALNSMYRWVAGRRGRRLQHYQTALFPLDRVQDWNRLYGRSGFFSYQCVLPHASARDGIRTLLRRTAASGQGSFLATLKTFGELPSPGMLSFPRPGVTLALDFLNHGSRTQRLLSDLDDVVAGAGGALYPAKDARMSVTMFRRGFPQWERFAGFVDPAFSSTFWRRINP
ncbi:MAG: FAD-binding oxidoreductase [Thioalkalivibrio sp.]|nr:MAG: FAD-binding oxidoreductase [Thioalkalivibrio sp.]